MEIYRGASKIDNTRIIAVSTETANRKTGNQIQIWILNANYNPLEAIKNNADRSVCGDCKHRGSTCYVAVHHAPLGVYRAWLRGKYAVTHNLDYLKNRSVRFGAFGDPAALPFNLIQEIAQKSKNWTGYTHQWKLPYAKAYQPFLMASVDNLTEYEEAKANGWRTFRVKNHTDKPLKSEISCPASIEAGKKSSCEKCGLCCGTHRKAKDIVINVHGLPFKQNRFSLL